MRQKKKCEVNEDCIMKNLDRGRASVQLMSIDITNKSAIEM